MSHIRAPTQEFQSHHFNSKKWEGITLRDNDIVVATAYKSGTTWMQNIVKELIFFGRQAPEHYSECSPWLDLRIPPIQVQAPMLESLTERRAIKTHLPVEALPFSSKVKYIYVGRDGRDCYMSLVNHYRQASDLWYGALNGPGLVGEPIPRFTEEEFSEAKYFDRWISEGLASLDGQTDGWPFWSLFDNVASWWKVRHEPNVLMIHFADMKSDLASAIRQIASFLEIDVPEEAIPGLVQKLTFDNLKASVVSVESDSSAVAPPPIMWKNGMNDFFFKGTNGRWKSVLSAEQLVKFDAKVQQKFTADCAAWLEHGRSAIDPKTV